MGAVDELETHQRVLCAKNVCVDFIQLVPPQIVITVAGGPGKIALGHAMLLKGGQDLLGIFLRNGVDSFKLLPQLPLRLLCQGADSFAYL